MKSKMKSGKLYTVGFKKSTRRKMIAGLLVVLPIFVTFFVIKFLFTMIGGILSPVVVRAVGSFGFSPNSKIDEFIITAVAFILTFVALYFIGVVATNFLGKFIIRFYESILHNVPVIKNVYTSSKKLLEIISLPTTQSFKRVVIVEYPRVGMKAFAFVTGGLKTKDGAVLSSIFIPTTPNPTSGFLIYLPEQDIEETDLSIEEGMKLIVSGGILVPDRMDLTTDTQTSEAHE
ncbi:MAG: DUF502 domain-containing protein [Candidatus Scalindua sp.]|jgi:uncharacterized membrane protein|nr:DUF502 domain-containing protein [Candidatus Scalindua sp.]MBT5306625.1 DUF502 domain-containing protein [Candidatus Scalindua sp.]MBT6050473.1 DUF502 domain-containing protein [Candidatus Scalindua sp.]MBT6227674.1 DUF502 domain-containing protein [Candidatus Scalindua sp.]MBT6561438.1 DUF502 domain-containing protein [Candidatus Scalindua sp.]